MKAYPNATAATGDDATGDGIFDDFFACYESAAEPAAVLADFCRRCPGGAGKFQALAARSDQMRAAAAALPIQRLPAGKMLGPFCIVREIAAGGMGVIYEARQLGLERCVALKTIRAERASPEARERFVREQQALALLHHTHIVPVFASGVDGELQYFGMQFIHGVTLHRLIQRLQEGELAAWNGPAPLLAKTLAHLDDPPPAEAAGKSLPATFPASYFRFAAQIVAEAAEAVDSAHQRQVIHRDLKPANLMLDEQGKCWLIDFGLARLPPGHAAGNSNRDGGDAIEPQLAAMTHQALGTQPYMSPEHFALRADERSDVWSLGAILYELLTLRRAYPGSSLEHSRFLIETNAPLPPAEYVQNVPPTLAAIFTKATRSRPEDRYATAAEMASDLRSWLDHRPTGARRVAWPERLQLWARHNPGRAWASATALLMSGAALLGLMFAFWSAARLSTTRANAALERVALAEQSERKQRREILLRDLVQVRLGTHDNGWTQKAEELIDKIAPLGVDEELRTQAASCLLGMDAKKVGGFRDAPAWSVAVSPDSKWVLTAGPRAGIPTRLIEVASNTVHLSRFDRQSLATFFQDATPVQIGLPGRDSADFELWDVRNQRLLGNLQPPPGWTTDGLTWSISGDGSWLAIAGQGVSPDLQPERQILVCDLVKRQIAGQFAAAATALALSEGGRLLAIGEASGQVRVRDVSSREVLSEFTADRGRITALGLARSPLVPGRNPRTDLRFQLAVAAVGGTLTVWNLESGALVNYFRGSGHGIHAVSFSRDGVTLASAGRGFPRLWDVPSGQILTAFTGQAALDWVQDAKLSSDGSLFICASGPSPYGPVGGLVVWRCDSSRGVRSMRGLNGPVTKAWWSSDDSLVAGLSHTWQLAVWNSRSGELLGVFETHEGHYTDNAAALFSPDNRRLAFATQGEACLWDLTTQEMVARWPLGDGLCESLAYTGQGDLLLFRADRQGAGFVGRTYRLTPAQPPQVLSEYHGCSANIHDALLTPGGKLLVVDGWATSDRSTRTVSAVDPFTGELRWSLPAQHPLLDGKLASNRDGTLVSSYGVLDMRPALIEANTGVLIRPSDSSRQPQWISSTGEIAFETREGSTWTASREAARGEAPPGDLFTIDTGIAHAGMVRAEFSRDDRQIAWGGPSGEVLIADVSAVLAALSSRGISKVNNE